MIDHRAGLKVRHRTHCDIALQHALFHQDAGVADPEFDVRGKSAKVLLEMIIDVIRHLACPKPVVGVARRQSQRNRSTVIDSPRAHIALKRQRCIPEQAPLNGISIDWLCLRALVGINVDIRVDRYARIHAEVSIEAVGRIRIQDRRPAIGRVVLRTRPHRCVEPLEGRNNALRSAIVDRRSRADGRQLFHLRRRVRLRLYRGDKRYAEDRYRGD